MTRRRKIALLVIAAAVLTGAIVLRWLLDPALSPPGEYHGLTKLTGPALDVAAQGPIDVVLLSHHHQPSP